MHDRHSEVFSRYDLGDTILILHSLLVAVAFYFVCHVIFYAVPTGLQCCKENKMDVWVDWWTLQCQDTSEGKVALKLRHFCPVLPQLWDYLLGSFESSYCQSCASWQRVKLVSSVLENFSSCHRLCCPPCSFCRHLVSPLTLLVQRRMRPAWTGSQWTWPGQCRWCTLTFLVFKVELFLSLRNLWQITEYCCFLWFWHLALCTWGHFCL